MTNNRKSDNMKKRKSIRSLMDKTVASDATDSGSTPDGCTIKGGAFCAPPFMAKVR